MTTQYGNSIEVNGVRPDWLRDETIRYATTVENSSLGASDIEPRVHHNWTAGQWACVARIALPADHPYYTASAADFTYWPGGESAPDDWDGNARYGGVLLRDGRCGMVGYWYWQPHQPSADIIGYRKRRPDHGDIAPETIERMVRFVRDTTANDPDTDYLRREATAIAKLLPPEPVDPILLRAREICAETDVEYARFYLKGENDTGDIMRAVMRALRDHAN
jgi:hypothetical protein